MPRAVNFPRVKKTFMIAANVRRNFLIANLFCAAALFSGCSRRDAAPVSGGTKNSSAADAAPLAAPPLDQQIEQKLDPLTADDVEIYLKVMRAAADRVKHLTPADQATLDGAKKILVDSAAGRLPTKNDVKVLERANLVATSMDQIVAEEMKLDGRAYRGIVEAVEAAVPYATQGTAPGSDRATAADSTPTPLEKQLSSVNTANEKFLAPRREEIQQLITVVRDPANLPK